MQSEVEVASERGLCIAKSVCQCHSSFAFLPTFLPSFFSVVFGEEYTDQ